MCIRIPSPVDGSCCTTMDSRFVNLTQTRTRLLWGCNCQPALCTGMSACDILRCGGRAAQPVASRSPSDASRTKQAQCDDHARRSNFWTTRASPPASASAVNGMGEQHLTKKTTARTPKTWAMCEAASRPALPPDTSFSRRADLCQPNGPSRQQHLLRTGAPISAGSRQQATGRHLGSA
jgi:hypothetical protein